METLETPDAAAPAEKGIPRLDASTRLAFERTRLAHNNTLTSWIEFGLAMITIGLLSLLLGTLEYWRDLKKLRAECPAMPRSTTGALAALMLALGIAALLLVILRQ